MVHTDDKLIRTTMRGWLKGTALMIISFLRIAIILQGVAGVKTGEAAKVGKE